MTGPEPDVTTLLGDWSRGDRDALAKLVPIVYQELRALAASYLRREPAPNTLQPTALVHEVYLRFAGQRQVDFHNRTHFYGAAAQIIRRVLVDHAREKQASKRGGDAKRVTLDAASLLPEQKDVEIVKLDDALSALEEFDPKKARLVELRYFAGLSV
ncbi:MAG: RNA polymerase subunit sigma-70, partial [Acidobacteriia bacterium]|nr:RNA polymerase subunit sigma-70 [Terriglobia bacterium]